MNMFGYLRACFVITDNRDQYWFRAQAGQIGNDIAGTAQAGGLALHP